MGRKIWRSLLFSFLFWFALPDSSVPWHGGDPWFLILLCVMDFASRVGPAVGEAGSSSRANAESHSGFDAGGESGPIMVYFERNCEAD